MTDEALLVKGLSLLVVLAFARLTGWRPSRPKFDKPRRDGLIALGFVILGLSVITWVSVGRLKPSQPPPPKAETTEAEPAENEPPEEAEPAETGTTEAAPDDDPEWYNPKWEGWTPGHVIRRARNYSFQLIPFVALLLILRQSPATIGLTRRGLGRALQMGLLLGFLPVIIYGPGLLGRLPVVVYFEEGEPLFFLAAMLVTGFVEEIIFRGYIQLRLVAWLGSVPGISISVLFFAVVHVPFQLGQGRGGAEVAWGLAGHAASGIVFSLALHKSQNLVAPGLAHSLGNWSA